MGSVMDRDRTVLIRCSLHKIGTRCTPLEKIIACACTHVKLCICKMLSVHIASGIHWGYHGGVDGTGELHTRGQGTRLAHRAE